MNDTLTAGAPASAKTLADICDRVALSLDAGIDIRRVWRSEAKRVAGRGGRLCAQVAEAIDTGQSLDQAVRDAGPFFPPLMVAMVRVGEQTGTSSEVFRRLASHYQRQVERGREFRSAVAWPVLQLVIALLVVGVMIAIGGVLQDARGRSLDLLGLGLVGERGLFIYLNSLVGLSLVIGLGVAALRRQPVWAANARRYVSELPVVGPAFCKIALERIAWALQMTMNVQMDLRRVAPIVLNASDNRRYAQHGRAVATAVGEGDPLSVAFERTGVFPRPFLDMLEVAEESGTIVESMDRLSKRYAEEADQAVGILSRAVAFLVWLAVAGLIIGLIFRVFGFYTGMLNQALEGL